MRSGRLRVFAGSLALLFWIAACGGAAEEQGGLDQPCFENETCDVPYVCEEGTCVESDEEQGGLGESCYSNRTCDDPYVCEEGICAESGGDVRGGLGEPCYANQTCDDPYVCEGGTCAESGGEDQGGLGEPCYANRTCDDPYVCEEGICAESGGDVRGGLGEPCYANQTCDDPYVCEGGTCAESGGEDQGGLGEPCYANQTCDDPYVCEGGTCVDVDPSPTQTTVGSLRDDTDYVCAWSSGLPADCETYEIQGLVAVSPIYNVTSGNPPLRGFFAEQDPSAGDRTFGGILVTFREADNSGLEIADIVPGTIVDVIGVAVMRFGNLQLSDSLVEVKGTTAEPEPVFVSDSATLAGGGTNAVAYQGVLVEVREVEAATERDQYGAFSLTSGLWVDRYFYEAPVEIGRVYTSLVGPVVYSYNESRILPRSASDVQF